MRMGFDVMVPAWSRTAALKPPPPQSITRVEVTHPRLVGCPLRRLDSGGTGMRAGGRLAGLSWRRRLVRSMAPAC